MIEDILARQMKMVLDSLATNREKLHVISELTEDDLVAWLRIIHKKGDPT
jgi:hypothetical protein